MKPFEYTGRGKAMLSFQTGIEDLAKKDLWVFGGQTKKPYGEFSPP